jgi:uncharacterized protein (DUF1697 family)
MSKTRYIALLRGINVGGSKKIEMATLRTLLASLGFEHVKTLLASGNAAWDAEGDDITDMRSAIEQGIEATFGFSVSVIVRPREQVERLVASDPFKDVEVTKNTRLYVTFLPAPATTQLEIPYYTPTPDFTILSVTDTAVCSVLTLSPTSGTVDAMRILERAFGKNITSRNWNTVVKLAGL